jgi:hypothetical protein
LLTKQIKKTKTTPGRRGKMQARSNPLGFASAGVLLSSPAAAQADQLSGGPGVVQSAAIDTEDAFTTRRRNRQ